MTEPDQLVGRTPSIDPALAGERGPVGTGLEPSCEAGWSGSVITRFGLYRRERKTPMHGKHSLGADLSVHVALPTAAELLVVAESTGKPVELHAVATLSPGDAGATLSADDAEPDSEADWLERIHDAVGRLALLEYSASQARDEVHRRDIFREMFALAKPLPTTILPFCEDTAGDNYHSRLHARMLRELEEVASGGDAQTMDAEPSVAAAGTEPPPECSIARAVAIRFLSPLGSGATKFVAGTWHPELFTAVAAEAYASAMAQYGVTVRCYDVAVDLDRGTVKVTPQPGFAGMVEKPEYVEDPDIIRGPEAEVEEPDDPIELGDVSFERSPCRWRVYLIDTERDRIDGECVVEFADEFGRRTEAMGWIRRWARKPIGVAAVAVGPGEGPVTVRCMELFDGGWSVYQADVSPDADASLVAFCDGSEAKRLSKRVTRKGGCPVIITPYKAEGDR